MTSLMSNMSKMLDASCFDGVYVTGDISAEYLDVRYLNMSIIVIRIYIISYQYN